MSKVLFVAGGKGGNILASSNTDSVGCATPRGRNASIFNVNPDVVDAVDTNRVFA